MAVELISTGDGNSLREPAVGSVWSYAGNSIPIDLGGPAHIAYERFTNEWIESPFIARFEHIAQQYGNHLAVDDGQTRLTYAELREATYRLAQLIESATPAGKPVGVLLTHDARFPLAALACLAAGRFYVPIDAKHPAARIQEIITEAGMDVVVTDPSLEAAHAIPAELTHIDIAQASHASGSTWKPNIAGMSANDPAVILYTSGSTGKPKGICNSQRGILQRVAASTNSCHVHAGDRLILLSSPWTVAGTRETFTALLNGASLHIADPRRHGINGVLKIAQDNRVTFCYTVPALLRTLLGTPGAQQAFSHLRIMRIAGDVTLASDLALCRNILPQDCLFLASFSSTEMPNAFQWFVPRDWQPDGARVPVGHPQPDVGFMVIDGSGNPVVPGEIGELVVRSRYVAIGYWKDGKLQPGPFLPDSHDPSIRVQHTGDLMRQRPDGLWELVGRKDRQIKIRGQRIDPGEVEAVLRGCEVRDAAVIPRRIGDETVALVAFVVPRHSNKSTLADDIRQALASRLPAHMRPADIRLLEALPMLPGFKTDMAALARMDREECERTAAADRQLQPEPAGSVRAVVTQAWSSVLGAHTSEADMPWDETGGDSLKAMELWFRIEQKLGRKIPMDLLQESTTPSKLAMEIERMLQASAANSNDAGKDAKPVVFLMPGILGDEPLLSHFRAAFGWNVRFKVIEYPEWRSTDDANSGFEQIIDAAYAQICAEPPCESYALAGYSFGGYVAFETARRLQSSGRQVGFLGLIDSRMWGMSSAMGQSRMHALIAQAKRYLGILADPPTLARLVRKKIVAAARFVQWAASSRPSTALSFAFYRERNYQHRVDALRRWRLLPLDMPITLYLSDQGLEELPPDYGWGQLCTELSIVRVGGTHASMLESPRREVLRTHLLDAVLPSRTDMARQTTSVWSQYPNAAR